MEHSSFCKPKVGVQSPQPAPPSVCRGRRTRLVRTRQHQSKKAPIIHALKSEQSQCSAGCCAGTALGWRACSRESPYVWYHTPSTRHHYCAWWRAV